MTFAVLLLIKPRSRRARARWAVRQLLIRFARNCSDDTYRLSLGPISDDATRCLFGAEPMVRIHPAPPERVCELLVPKRGSPQIVITELCDLRGEAPVDSSTIVARNHDNHAFCLGQYSRRRARSCCRSMSHVGERRCSSSRASSRCDRHFCWVRNSRENDVVVSRIRDPYSTETSSSLPSCHSFHEVIKT